MVGRFFGDFFRQRQMIFATPSSLGSGGGKGGGRGRGEKKERSVRTDQTCNKKVNK